MKSIETFLSEISQRSGNAGLTPARTAAVHGLHPRVRQAAAQGLAVFPVPDIARLTGNPDILIGEATTDLFRLEELAGGYPGCTWRSAVGLSRLCIIRIDGIAGREWFSSASEDHGGPHTLSVVRGEAVWAIFNWPAGLVLRPSARVLAPGVRILTDGESFPIPPSRGCTWADPSAEIEEVPHWLRVKAFEPPDSPPPTSAQVPQVPRRPMPCRARARFPKPPRKLHIQYSNRNRAAWRWGWHAYRHR